MNKRVLLNVGCGHQRPLGWINTDCSINAQLQRIGCIRWLLVKVLGKTQYSNDHVRYMHLGKPWPFLTASVDVVYGSHIYEHLNKAAARLFLKEAKRVLKPGGVLRLAVPDLQALAEAYIRNLQAGDAAAADKFLGTVNMHQDNIYGDSHSKLEKFLHAIQGYPHQHKFMYDHLNLSLAIKNEGFELRAPQRYAESELVPEIGEVESTAEGVPTVYLEASR